MSKHAHEADTPTTSTPRPADDRGSWRRHLDLALKVAFVAGYASTFLLNLPSHWIPDGQRYNLTVAAYVVFFVLGALGWRAGIADRFRQILAGKGRALATLLLGLVLVTVLEVAGGWWRCGCRRSYRTETSGCSTTPTSKPSSTSIRRG